MIPETPPMDAASPRTVNLFELLRSLWEGDDLVMGYQSTSIVFRLCTLAPRYTKPNPQWILNHVRAGFMPVKDCEAEELSIIEAGLKLWENAGSPRATLDPQELENGS